MDNFPHKLPKSFPGLMDVDGCGWARGTWEGCICLQGGGGVPRPSFFPSEVKQENPYKFIVVISPPGFNPFMTWIHASSESFIFLDLGDGVATS